jgi:hypothetical protein
MLSQDAQPAAKTDHCQCLWHVGIVHFANGNVDKRGRVRQRHIRSCVSCKDHRRELCVIDRALTPFDHQEAISFCQEMGRRVWMSFIPKLRA